jgi:hypothetical protein
MCSFLFTLIQTRGQWELEKIVPEMEPDPPGGAAMELCSLVSVLPADGNQERKMGRYLLLWLLGVPIPILLLIWFFGGLH